MDTSYAEIQLRPSASNGWWLSYLLLATYSVNCWKYEFPSIEYKFSTVMAFGMVLQTEIIHYSPKIGRRLVRSILYAIPPTSISLLLIFFLYQGFVFSSCFGIIIVITYHALFSFILRIMPRSFSYGEASIVTQGIVIFLMNFYMKMIVVAKKTTDCIRVTSSISCVMYSNSFWAINLTNTHHMSEMEQLTTILQIGLFGVAFLVGCCFFVKFFRGTAFYALLGAVAAVIVLFPIEDEVAIVILIKFLTKDLQKLCMMSLYIGLIGMTVATVAWQMNRTEQSKSNTRTRKIFHFLIVLVFVPGLIYQCAFIYVASGIALALLIVLETMRIIQLWPMYNILEDAVKCFIDEKDAGFAALTPIYLLIGCSMPLYLHPCPCDLTDSAGFEILPLMAGVISVGVGDTAASVFGSSRFGKTKWWNCQKTVEGTIAGIVAQGLILPLLIYFGLARYSALVVAKYLIAITTSSLVETFTDQVDNLILPIITFILLSL